MEKPLLVPEAVSEPPKDLKKTTFAITVILPRKGWSTTGMLLGVIIGSSPQGCVVCARHTTNSGTDDVLVENGSLGLLDEPQAIDSTTGAVLKRHLYISIRK